MKIIESYDEKTQRIIGQMCGMLMKRANLECYKSGHVIDDIDSVYFEKKALVSEDARTIADALYLGTLSELREWCREQGCDNGIELPSGPVTLDLSPSDEEFMDVYLEEDAAPDEYEEDED
ncbi:MAG: hypothetical protein ACFFEV_01915 [Candidatus Thorarchaeota archaeon]